MALALSTGLACFAAAPAGAGALLALRPGPIDRPLHLLSADFDRDGLDDLIVANFQAGTLTLLINQGNGAFSPHPDSPFDVGSATFSTPSAGPVYLAATDLNPEDVDGDRVPNALDTCPNVFNPADFVTGLQADSESAAGADAICGTADDNPYLYGADVLCGTADDGTGNGVGDACQLKCLGGTEDGETCVLDSDCPGGVCDPIDTDGDGKLDYDDTFDPLEPDPDLKLAAALDNCPRFPNPVDPMTGRQSDADGDRVGDECADSPDLVIVERGFGGFRQQALGFVRVRVNDGSAGLLSRPTFDSGLGPAAVILKDFTADGRPDLVVSNAGGHSLFLYPGLAICVGGTSSGTACVLDSDCTGGVCGQDGRFGTAQVLRAGICVEGLSVGARCSQDVDCGTPVVSGSCRGGPQGLAAADFNGDGNTDLAVADPIADAIRLYLNTGSGLPEDFTDPIATQSQPTTLLTGNLDMDVCPDLVAFDQGPMSCVGGVMAGMTCRTADDCPGGSCALETAGNGLIQVFRHSSCAPGSLPEPGAALALMTGQRPRGGLIADLDGDGTLDLAVTDVTGPTGSIRGETLIFTGDGAGSFASPPTVLVNTGGSPSSPVSVAALGESGGPPPDLAVLNFSNRIDLFRNDGSGGFTPSTPLSPWTRLACAGGPQDGEDCSTDTDCASGDPMIPSGSCVPRPGASGLVLMAADTLVALDMVLLKRSPPAVDILTGIGNGFFRSTGPLVLTGPQSATGMLAADLRQDNLLDLLVLDGTGGKVTVLTSELTGEFVERDTLAVGSGPERAAAGTLVADPADYDRDGVPNNADNCPTRANGLQADLQSAAGPDGVCGTTDDNDYLFGTDGMCGGGDDGTGNGVGDLCEVLDAAGLRIDSDLDGKFDYDDTFDPSEPDPDARIAAALDNCPWVSNSGQADADGDRVGDACDDGVCTIIGGSLLVCKGGTDDRRPCAGERLCSGGANAGTVCTADTDCPGGTCPVQCPGGACTSSLGLCAGGASAGQVCAVASDCPDGSCHAARGVCDGGGDDGEICNGLRLCSGGTNAGGICTMDASCPGGSCLEECAGGGICTESLLVCLGGPNQGSGCFEDTECGAGVNDLVVTHPSSNEVDLLIGDGAASLRPAAGSPISFTRPAAALIGEFSLVCAPGLGGIDCRDKPTSDILVAGGGVDPDDPVDDRLQVLVGNGQETGFSATDSPEVGAPRGAGVLLSADDQPVCADPSTTSPPLDPEIRFDNDNRSTVIAVFEPGQTTIDIFLVGGRFTCIGGTNEGVQCIGPADTTTCLGGGTCKLVSRLLPPPGHLDSLGQPYPLPVANPLVDAAFVDLNRDDVLDLVAVSSGGFPASTNLTVYMGIADGLFFTEPSFNPAGVPNGAVAITTGNVNLVSDFTYPEIAILNQEDDAPIVLTNILTERADIDGSGRVDGFDLAILARAFGATRGENFIIQPDGTLQQTRTFRCLGGVNSGAACTSDADCEDTGMPPNDGTCEEVGYRSLVDGELDPMNMNPVQRVGQDLPDFVDICDGALDPLEGLYGLPVDVNLDGDVDGEDLAFIASLFGRAVPR
jgi:hypothetical protein